MLEAVRRYARKVLLFHLFLLGVVTLVVLGAARSVYRSARQQAIRENEKRLQLLSDQTARGIENYYLGVMSDLEAFLHSDGDTPATQPNRPQRPGERIMNRLRGVNAVNSGIINDLYKQLGGRVSGLFVVDRQTGDLWGSQGNRESNNEIARSQQEWITSLKEPAMSRFQPGTDASKGGYHLIAIPAEGRRPEPPQPPPATGPAGSGPPNRRPINTPQIIVAVVPVQPVNDRFLDAINDQGDVNAALLDDVGTVLVSIDPQLAGKNAVDEMSPNARALIRPYVTGDKDGAVVIPFSYQIDSLSYEPRILAFHAIVGLPGRRWTVLTSAPLSDAETVVKDLFGEAMIWAIFVSLSVTGILASTSFFMIRSRVRYERARHDLLARELDQARQIQLAWLPDAEKPPAGLEVSAANLPASHISGDFYNWFHLPAPSYSKHTAEPQDEAAEGSKIAIVIGDVTGHGMAAAFLMATTQLLVRTTLSRYQDPGRCLQEVNKQLCTQGFRGQFVTMLVLVLDPRSSSIEIATAGHPSPLVERQGKFESLEMEPQLVLGVDPAETYKTEGFILEPGASIMLYTDGVVEAEASSGEQYGLERLCAALSAERTDKEPQRRIEAVLEDVKRFCAEKDLADDVTLVAVRTMAAAVGITAGIGT